MTAPKAPGGGESSAGRVVRIKRHDFIEPILHRAAQKHAEASTTLYLYQQAIAALDKLALHASGSTLNKGRFAVAMLAPMCVQTSLLIAEASEPAGNEDFLVEALAISVGKLSQAVQANPARFVNAARARTTWPVLWTLKENAEQHRTLAKDLQLGAGLGLKNERTFCLATRPNKAVVDAIQLIKHLKCLFNEDPLRVKPTLRHVAETPFPQLTGDPASVEIWWSNGIKPVLEFRRADLEKSGFLNNYLAQAHNSKTKSCRKAGTRKDNYRAKDYTLAWHRFLGDCKAALQRLVKVPVTDKTGKKP